MTRSRLPIAALVLHATLGGFGLGCGTDEGEAAEPDPVADRVEQPDVDTEPAEESRSEATLAHDYIVAWQRCALTTRHRIEQSWSRYAIDFKTDIGKPRSKDIVPFVYRVTPTRARCAIPTSRPPAVPPDVEREGVAYLAATDTLAGHFDTLAGHFDALAANFEAETPDLEAVAELGPTFDADHQSWAEASAKLEAVLDPTRDEIDATWMNEIETAEGKQLRWWVADVVRSGRALRGCIGAAPKDAGCTAAIETFANSSGVLEGYCRKNPDARLGAFWLDVFRAKTEPLSTAAHASNERKPPRRKPEAFNAQHSASVRAAIDALVLAGDRVRFDFP